MTSKHRLRRRAVPFVVAIVGAGVSWAAFVGLRHAEDTRIDQEFRRRTQSLALNLEQSARACTETLFSLRDLFHYSDDVTRTEFTFAAADLMARHPTVFAFFWAQRIPAAKLAAYEAEVASKTQTDFKIYPRSGAENGQGASDSFAIEYVAPYGIVHLEGFDLAHSNAWPAFVTSNRDGEPRLLDRPSFLSQEIERRSSVLILPVYRNMVPTSTDERESLLRGFLLCLIDPGMMLEQAAAQISNHGLDAILVELVTPGNKRVLHAVTSAEVEPSHLSLSTFSPGQHARVQINIGGKNWELWTRPSPGWLESQRTYRASITATLSLLFSGLLAFYLRVLFRQTEAVEATVAERTLELTAAQRNLKEDIRRRIQIELALKTSEERYRTFVNRSSDSIWLLEFSDPIPVQSEPEHQVARILAQAHVAECNEPAARSYNHANAAEVVGKDLQHLAPHSKDRHQLVLNAFVRNQRCLTDFEASEGDVDGRIFLHNLVGVEEDGVLKGIWFAEHDLTAQRRMEQERQNFERRLADTQRLESLGVLAGGIAHDFNNLLTGILGHASLGRTELTPDSHLHDHFEQIENASRSAASLCQQMLAYAGKGRFVIKPENLSRIVSNTTHLLVASINKQAELRFNLQQDLPLAQVDATQIQQIIMNLVVNASEAIGPRPGVITLTSGLLEASESTFEKCSFAPEKLAARYVFLEVQDTGAGMSREVMSRIFEPFFTTKFAGRGLGLAATIGIVRRHCGALKVESEPGVGTRFTLFLPLPEEPISHEPVRAASNTPWQPEGKMLVVDDEEPVRNIAERIARSFGFEVVCASDGTRGLELFKQLQNEISVVLLDLSMPGLSGADLLVQLHSLSPKTKIIVMSGYNQPNLSVGNDGWTPGFLSKPFNIDQFQEAICLSMRAAK